MKMNINFGEYAKYYDLIYKDKDYRKEVDFIENIFKITYKPKSILEIGCGTGSYTKMLLKRGYEVTAVDISDDMLKIARKKCVGKFKVLNICPFLDLNGEVDEDVWNMCVIARLGGEKK
jgi:ubiquinone/menaquinone biosynthesis C-methylase UbiE